MGGSRHITRLAHIALLVSAILASSCGEDGPAPCGDCATTQPATALLAPEGATRADVLREGGAALMVQWGEGVAWVRADQVAHFTERDGEVRVREIPKSALPGAPLAAVALDATRLLVSTDAGLVVVTGEGVSPSPLQDQFRGVWPTQLAGRDGHIWLASAEGLFHWHADTLERVGAGEGAPITRGAMLADGPWLGDLPTIWASAGGQTFALSRDDEGFAWHTLQNMRGARSMTRSAGGLWVVTGTGAVMLREGDGESATWRTLQLDGRFEAIAAHPKHAGVWLKAEGGAVWHLTANVLTAAPAAQWGSARLVDAKGRLLVVTGADEGAKIERLDRRLAIQLDGLREGATLEEKVTATVQVTFPDEVASGEATVDDQPVSFDPRDGTIELDPATLGPGDHTLRVQVRFHNVSTAATLRRRFTAGGVTITWDDHIKPLSEASCETCHGVQASRALHTPAQWQADFDNILDQVERATMPLPPFEALDTRQINLLRAWRDQGFLISATDAPDPNTQE